MDGASSPEKENDFITKLIKKFSAQQWRMNIYFDNRIRTSPNIGKTIWKSMLEESKLVHLYKRLFTQKKILATKVQRRRPEMCETSEEASFVKFVKAENISANY